MTDPRAAVSDWIYSHADELVAALAQLVRIPSVVGREADAQAFMRELYAGMGLELDVFEPSREALAAHPAFVDSGLPFDGRPNVVGVWRGSGDGRGLILNGHTDVVSAEPASAWTHDPFGAAIVASAGGSRRGRMIGRGAMDMKGGLVANAFAVLALRACGVRLRGDVILESVVEEEAGGAGTLACFERGYGAGAQRARAQGFIATEPHWEDVCIAHPGVLYFRVVVEGRGAHAGRAHQGVNAAVELAPIVSMLGEWDLERARALHYEPFERLDPAARRSCHLNVGVVRAGDWPSTVPGQALAEVRMSFIPGETEAGVKREIAERVAAVAAGRPWLREHPPRIEFFGWHTEPWIQDENHPFVRSFVDVLRAEEGRRPAGGVQLPPAFSLLAQPMGITAGLDTRFAALYGLPAFAWGPKGAGLHGANEYVELDTVVETARVLALFAMGWCGRKENP